MIVDVHPRSPMISGVPCIQAPLKKILEGSSMLQLVGPQCADSRGVSCVVWVFVRYLYTVTLPFPSGLLGRAIVLFNCS